MHKKLQLSLLALVLAVIAGLLPTRVLAQGIVTGYITGTVVDPQGAVVPNASVTATQGSTNAKFAVTTLANGNFELRNLPSGKYTVTISAPGFESTTLPNVVVAVGVETALKNQVLTVGSSQQTVTVDATATPLLSTTQSQISTEFTPQQITALPVDAGFDTLALTAQPGVASAHDAMFGNSNGSFGYSGLSVNGERSRSVNFEIDGQNNNDNSVTGPQFFFNNGEALQAVQVVTGVYGAQYGRSTGAIVNYVTKSGTNDFHGSAFEFYTGSFLRSLTNDQKNPLLGFCAPGQSPSTGCTPVTVPRYVEHQYGATLGGPILKDRLWFFGSTFWDPIHEGASPANSAPNVTPTPNGLQQLQAAFPNNPSVNALLQFGPFAIKYGNPVVAGGIITKPVTVGNTTQQVEFGQVQRFAPATQRMQQHLGRLDWQPNTKDHLFLRYMYYDALQAGALSGTSVADIAQGDFYNVPSTNHSIGADWTRTFTSNWVNQLRYSFQQAKIGFTPGALTNCTVNNLTACPADVAFSSNDQSFGLGGGFPQGRTVKVTQVQDNATWIHGNHSVNFGGEFQKQNSPNVGLANYNGAYAFASFNSFMQGGSDPNDLITLADGSPVLPFSEPDVDGYIQDDWKVRPDLTLNLGLRYEWYDNSVNLLHDMTVKRETNPSTAFWNSALPLSQRTFESVPQDYKKVQPRIGFSWNPQFLNQKMVVRGGYAINADPIFYNMFTNAAASAPVVNAGNIACNGGCIPSAGIQGSAVRAQFLPVLPRGGDPGKRNQTTVAPNFHNPYAQTYTLGIQYELSPGFVAEVRYLGNHTIGNFQTLYTNPYLLPIAQDFPNYPGLPALCTDKTLPGFGRPDCTHSNVTSRNNTAFSVYNGLQAQLTTRAFHGLSAIFNYTYSRSVDNTSEIFSTGTGGNTSATSQNPLNTNLGERGVSGFSYPNIASVSALYDFPWFHNQTDWKGRLLGGFTLSAIYLYNTGQPFTVSQGFVSAAGDTSYDTPGKATGTARPVLSNPKAPLNTVGIYVVDPSNQVTEQGTGYYIYNATDSNGLLNQPTSASNVHWLWNNKALAKLLGNPFPGVGRNTLRGQDYNNLDASVYKNIAVTERVKLQLQLNAYNVLNHQFRGTPNVSVEGYSPTDFNPFLSNAQNPSIPRTLQIGGKFIF
jgi:outer membrane receptor protein involved in Fe transport